jgi:hypothetical protein
MATSPGSSKSAAAKSRGADREALRQHLSEGGCGSRAHRIATKSSHYVQIEEPQLVTDAIRQAVEAARAEKPPR